MIELSKIYIDGKWYELSDAVARSNTGRLIGEYIENNPEELHNLIGDSVAAAMQSEIEELNTAIVNMDASGVSYGNSTVQEALDHTGAYDVTQIKQDVSNIADVNLIGKNIYNKDDTNQHLRDAYVQYFNGRVTELSGWTSALLDVEGGRKISSQNMSGSHCCFFSVKHSNLKDATVPSVLSGFISGFTGNATGVSVPRNAVQMSISYPSDRSNVQIEYGESATAYEPYECIPAKLTDDCMANSGLTSETVVYKLKADGSGDFANLKSCLESITDSSAKKRYEVWLYPGEYNIASLYTDYSEKGLVIPNYVTIKGVGSKEKIIVKAELSAQSTAFSLFNPLDYFAIENITMRTKNCRYVIHDDFQSLRDSEAIHTIKNCVLIGENCSYGSVYGSGLKGSASWNFENCIFDANKASASGGVGNCISIHNNTNVTTPSEITIKNCRLKAHDITTSSQFNTLRLLSMTNGSENGVVYVHLIGNYIDGITMTENSASSYGAGCSFYVDGYCNKLPSYNDALYVSSSDGVDYSGRYQLI